MRQIRGPTHGCKATDLCSFSPKADKRRLQKGEYNLNYTKNYQPNQQDTVNYVLLENVNSENAEMMALAAILRVKLKSLTADTAATASCRPSQKNPLSADTLRGK